MFGLKVPWVSRALTTASRVSDNCSNGHCAPVVVFGDSEVRYAYIPAGTFWMGSSDGECPEGYPGACVDELGRDTTETLHEVTLTRPYFMHPHEVTQSEWVALFGYTPWDWRDDEFVDLPAVGMAFVDVVAYLNVLSLAEGLTPCYAFSDLFCNGDTDDYLDCFGEQHWGISDATISLNDVTTTYDCEGYRLPTEAEWEHAYRAGATTAFFNGEITETGWGEDPNVHEIAWYRGNSGNRRHIASDLNVDNPRSPNDWGLYDMAGNVYEWVFDSWDRSPYPSASVADPVFINTLEDRIVRGGCYDTFPEGNRAATRSGATQLGDRGRMYHIGFRPVRSSPVHQAIPTETQPN